jgi:hypothetical protein
MPTAPEKSTPSIEIVPGDQFNIIGSSVSEGATLFKSAGTGVPTLNTEDDTVDISSGAVSICLSAASAADLANAVSFLEQCIALLKK